MLRSSGFDGKLYTNNSTLCVVGDRLPLNGHRSSQRRYANRTVTLCLQAPENSGDERGTRKPEPARARRPLKVSVKELLGPEARNQQLRRVHESSDLEDLRRLLDALHPRDERTERAGRTRPCDVIAEVNPREVYEHFFGRHYEYLRGIAYDDK